MQVHLAEHTVDVELVELCADFLLFLLSFEKTGLDSIEEARPLGVESERELVDVHLACLAIGFVEHRLLAPAKRRGFTRRLEGI